MSCQPHEASRGNVDGSKFCIRCGMGMETYQCAECGPVVLLGDRGDRRQHAREHVSAHSATRHHVLEIPDAD